MRQGQTAPADAPLPPGAVPSAGALTEENLSRLGPYVMSMWRKASVHRQSASTVKGSINEKLISCLRDVSGVYTSEETRKITELEQPLVFINNPDAKRRTCNAIIRGVFIESADPAWTLKPSPVPDMSDDDLKKIADKTQADYMTYRLSTLVEQGMTIAEAQAVLPTLPPDPETYAAYSEAVRDEEDNARTEAARRKVDRMSRKIQDQLLDGDFTTALMEMVDYCSTYGTGILLGPIRRMKRVPTFTPDGQCVMTDKEVLCWEAVSPLDSYPAKGATSIRRGDFFRRVSFTPKSISAMLKMGDGYYPANIREVLQRYPNGGLRMYEPFDSERKRLENDGSVMSSETSVIEGIEGWCEVKGSTLIDDMAITATPAGEPLDRDGYYDVNAVVVDSKVLFCAINDERFGRPLFKAVFYRVPNSWWGDSPVEKMRDLTRAYNAAYRAKCVNVSCCSGPMTFINTAKTHSGQNFKMRPYAVHTWNDPVGNAAPPVKLFQAASNIPEITEDLNATLQMMDVATGIPSPADADDAAASAGRTYNGLVLILNARRQGANDVIFSMYNDALKPALEYLYRYNMLFDSDAGIKGDCAVDVGGLLSILVRDQNTNKLEALLNMMNNQYVAASIGQDGIAEILRQYIKTLSGVNYDKIVPSEEEIKRRQTLQEIQNSVAEQANRGGMNPNGSQPVATPSIRVRSARPIAPKRAPVEV